jgi:hypothetical protein
MDSGSGPPNVVAVATSEVSRPRPTPHGLCCGRRLSPGEQGVDGGDSHSVLSDSRKARVHRDQSVGLQPGDREVLGVPECVLVVLAGDLPGGAARDPVTEQPYLYLGHALVGLQGCRFGAPSCPDAVQQKHQPL